MEIKITSNSMIKPSSPTPDNLQIYKLSFLDQMSPRAYCPFIYYYSSLNSNANPIAEFSTKLKESLSETLTLYYPLAGRIVKNFLQCDDEGALFIEARAVGTKLSTVLKSPVDMSELSKLLPVRLDEIPKLPLAVKFTAFECGGTALGVCVDHHIADALSSLVFLQIWASIARGRSSDDAIKSPDFVSGEIFPPKDGLVGLGASVGAFKGMCEATVTKRFVFEGSKIEALRVRVSENGKPLVSRVSALSAFTWTRFARSTGLGEPGHTEKEYAVILAANIRSKCDPPLPNNSFGNYYALSPTTGPVTKTLAADEHFRSLGSELGQNLRKIDGGFVGFVRENGTAFLGSIEREQARVLKGEVVGFFLSSLCRFPVYEADFGFGKPIWVSSAARGFQNEVTFFDKKDSDGIEAFICLKPEDMAKLEADNEFLSFVTSTDPIIGDVDNA